MRVFIYACEDLYAGLHGINSYGVVEITNLSEIDEYGREWSTEVIESYGCFDDYYTEEEIEELDDDDIEDCYAEHRQWSAWKIRDDVTESTKDLDAIAARIGDEAFVEEYCEELEGY